jgi:hypothetical protein
VGRAGRRTKVAAALAAGAVPFALGIGTASADEGYSQSFAKDHTFTAGDGHSVTCTFSGYSSLQRFSGQNTFDGQALTDAFGDDPACDIHFVAVIVTYTDGSGRQRQTGADSIDGDVRWFGDDVASGFSVLHSVTFDDCRANCEATFTTQPK